MKRTQPATSLDAFKSLHPSQIREMYHKILEALKSLGSASTEQIAEFLTVDHPKVHRRVSEMASLQMIYRPGIRVATKSGRTAFVWTICGENQPKTESEIVYKSEEKTAAEYAGKLIQMTKNTIQPKLF